MIRPMKFYFVRVFPVQDRYLPVLTDPKIWYELLNDTFFFVSIELYVVKRLNFKLRRLSIFFDFNDRFVRILAGFPVGHLLNLIWL